MNAKSNSSSKSIVVLDSDLIDSAKPRTFTLANAAAGARAARTPAQAAAYLAGAKQAMKSADELKQVAAAYSVAVGIRQGMTQVAIAKAMGLAESTITGYKRMHLALEKGITPVSDPTTWTALGSGGMSTDREVGKALSEDRNTKADLVKVIAKQAKAKADKAGDTPAKGKGKGKGKGKATGGTTTQSNTPDWPRGHSAQITWMETLVARLGAGKALSPKERERAESVWDGLGLILHGESEQATGTDG